MCKMETNRPLLSKFRSQLRFMYCIYLYLLNRRILLSAAALFLLVAPLHAQTVTKEDYQRAEQFLYQNVGDLVFRANVNPSWAHEAPIFWYRVDTRRGEEYFYVDAAEQTKRPFFNHEKLAENLSEVLGEPVDPYDLPIGYLDWNREENYFRFRHDDRHWQVDLESLEVQQVEEEQDEGGRLRSTSPDGRWTVTRKNYDLYLKNNESGKVSRLTDDGEALLQYGASLPWAWKTQVGPRHEEAEPLRLNINWSEDSKKFYAGKLDLRTAKKMYLLQNVPDSSFRAQVVSYYRALPGEDSVAQITPYVFDVQTKQQTAIQTGPYDQLGNGGWSWYGSGSGKLYAVHRERGYGSATLLEADASTGAVDTVFHERSETYVDPLNNEYEFLPETHELLWLSERDGWNHIYLYDLESGRVKQQVTSGEYVVKDLVHIDSENRTIFFTAGGREEGRDPYLNHFYRVNFDGSDLRLLTPENATHEVTLSPGQRYFADTYSRVDRKPVTVLRSAEDGEVLMKLEEADIQDLLATGWQYPEPFKVKARDGKTDIYGVIYRPSNFDSTRKYPIIDGTYSGPQAVRTPKSFRGGYRNSDQPLAELGFIVVTVDGLGTAQRSRAFHHYSYKNLGDIGLPDHVKAIRELARTYPYMDTTRVGIYGHSAGGYDAARALLLRPDFYKVGVSSAGNHDHRVAKAWWPELYMDYPAGPQYEEQSNIRLAEKLKGYLLIAHGDMDDNVHPTETYRLAHALIEAGKSFDMLIMPNEDHGMSGTPYFTKVRWNYFVEHLLGAEPIRHYQIGEE